MKTKNFNLLFYLKKVKGYESGNLPIYLRISVDGKRSEATIGRGIEPEKWDEKRGKVLTEPGFVDYLYTFFWDKESPHLGDLVKWGGRHVVAYDLDERSKKNF
jgi:hypothetical protein